MNTGQGNTSDRAEEGSVSNAAICPERKHLVRFLLGQLPEPDITGIERHLESCGCCGETLAELRQEDTHVFQSLDWERTRVVNDDQLLVDSLVRQISVWPAPDSLPAAAALSSPLLDRSPQLELEAWLKGVLRPAEAEGEFGRLGPFVLRRIVGIGGMGVVFEADEPGLKRKVAVKILKPELAVSQNSRKRFLREAQAAAAIEDENVVAIHNVGEDNGLPYLAMAFLPGMTLQEYIASQGILDVDTVLWIARKTAAGLAAAHHRGVIHRDIKPTNIFLSQKTGMDGDGHSLQFQDAENSGSFAVKLLDFGLAQAIDDDASSTERTVLAGTPSYMSPEQAQGHSVDARSDLFSLGCVLYRMSTGECPFGGPNKTASLLAVVQRQPCPPHDMNPAVPQALSNIIMRLLEKDPNRRYQSAGEVIQALRSVRTPSPSKQKIRIARSWLLPAAIVLALFVMMTIVQIVTDKGTLVVEINEPDVKVLVDGSRVELKSPRDTIELKVGEHELTVTKDGFTSYTKRFQLKRGDKVEVTARLEPTAAKHASSERAAHGVDVALEIPSARQWTATGVVLREGMELKITATGTIDAAPAIDERVYYHEVPPSGRSERIEHFPEPALPGLALIGRIGNGSPFVVGEDLSFIIKPTDPNGELYLGINDDLVEDNSGVWKVKIKTRPSSR